MLIDVCKISKDFGFGEIFSDISFSVNNLDRVALVGRNGCGKSTVLKIIAGIENCKGTINIAHNLSMGFLEQTAPDQNDERCVREILYEPFEKFNTELLALKSMEEKMLTLDGEKLIKYIEKYSERQEKFINSGGYEIDNTIAFVVNGLKINKMQLDAKYNTLSGGEKTLVHFARILLEEPDVLLLDEPTNHLDIERIEWLENYLNKFKGAVVLISHDRYFLDNVARRIIDIEDGGEIYEGNYSYFVKAKENKELKEFEQYKNEQRKLSELKNAVKRLYEWGKKSDNPATFRRAKAIQKRIDEMEANATNKPKERKELNLNFKKSDRRSDIAFNLENFSLILGDKILYDDASMQIRVNDKVALVGSNGSGKSSLIKCLIGESNDYMGKVQVGASVNIGYLSQLLVFPSTNQKILDYMECETGLKEEESRRMLAQFDFYKNDVEKQVGCLSGGEKVRLKLAIMINKPINTLVFDEPTNHIDIFTRETLEEAMKKFKGTILFVSHDRYFMDSVATKILEIKDKKLKMYDGNYCDYKNNTMPKLIVESQKVSSKIKTPRISKGGKWS